jgi:hypothetical protein
MKFGHPFVGEELYNKLMIDLHCCYPIGDKSTPVVLFFSRKKASLSLWFRFFIMAIDILLRFGQSFE